MNGTTLQIILFFVLIGEGFLTRLLFSVLNKLQSKANNKVITVITDVSTAVIGAGVMILTCLLMSNTIRVFYAVFFLGGIAIAQLTVKRSGKKEDKKCTEQDCKKQC